MHPCISGQRDSEYFANKIKDTGGVYVVPAFAGLGAPYWDMNARGAIVGITRGTGREQIIRASLESIAYQTNDLIHAMEQDGKRRIPCLRVDGGASANDFLMQFQANISNTAVFRPSVQEATAAGAAYLAGLAVGFYSDRAELTALNSEGRRFTPDMPAEERKALLSGWSRAVSAARV